MNARVNDLGNDIFEFQSRIANHATQKHVKKQQRAKDHAACLLEFKGYSESVLALEWAIALIKPRQSGSPSAALFLLLASTLAMIALPLWAESHLNGPFCMLWADGEDVLRDFHATPTAVACESRTGFGFNELRRFLKK